MLKAITWISLALTILGTVADFAGGDPSGDAAELAMIGQLLGGPETAPPDQQRPRR